MEHLSLMCQEKMYIESHQLSRLNSVNSAGGTNHFIYSEPTDEVNDHGSPWYPMSTQRIEHIPFAFDPIGILPLCHLTEQLFSMFLELSVNSNDNVADKPNMLLLDNIQEHLGYLHDQELELSRESSEKFTQHILFRHKNKHPNYCPIRDPPINRIQPTTDNPGESSQWRCFLKGISVTHIILTFVPSTLQDLKHLVDVESPNISMDHVNVDAYTSSKDSSCSDVPIHSSKSLVLPIYIFDCPLAVLVNAYINNVEENRNFQHDAYENHLFRYSDYILEDCIRLKSGDSSRKHHDIQNEEADTVDLKNTSKSHCKALVLAHSKCFTVSLFLALHLGHHIHASDVQSAMDQCEEEIVEIDITEYLKTVCGHLKNHHDEAIEIQHLHQATPCSELQNLHMLIKEKFLKIVSTSFSTIPTNTEFYFCRDSSEEEKEKFTDSDDDNTQSTTRLEKDPTLFAEDPPVLRHMNSCISNTAVRDLNPLFLHFMCTLRYNSGYLEAECLNTSIRVIPTCLGELIQEMSSDRRNIDKLKLQVTLDIFYLTLPKSVREVIANHSLQGLRTTSFCSDGFRPSISSTVSQNSFSSEHDIELHNLEPHCTFPKSQKRAVVNLESEIKWLLQDEMATALLDIYPVSIDSLNFVTKHVTESDGKSSCILDIIKLNFVFGSETSREKFVQEFSNIYIHGYDLCQQDDMYYLVKVPKPCDMENQFAIKNLHGSSEIEESLERQLSETKSCANSDGDLFQADEGFNLQVNVECISQQSDVSNESVSATDIGYDEDVSDNYDEYEWLLHMCHKREHLPNFWLIMRLEEEAVTIYFHCRFLDLPTSHVVHYLETQKIVGDAVRDICKRVNQSLLLQSMYETRICDQLLEPEDILKDWTSDIFSNMSNGTSYNKLRSMDEALEETEVMTVSSSVSSAAALTFKPGEFSCPVVWETHFILHPRLKTGPGKPGISRGVLALKNILDKFSVSNRSNMFVYQDRNTNVFYLRLHENVHNSCHMKSASPRSNEFESLLVSRSPSVTSLPLSQPKRATQSEHSIPSTISSDIRPRVRSFGEKESKEDPPEDTLILKVHGITEAGTDIQHDLVQVLQNRLDDAVLEFLSIMLARNAMCPLTPEDVHFIQRPFRSPEVVLRLSLHDCAMLEVNSLIHYLQQNLLQFLNIPKYTDGRSHYHFQDYSESDGVGVSSEDNIFIYNQSQIPSSGSRGIACICFTLITNKERQTGNTMSLEEHFNRAFVEKAFDPLVDTAIIESSEHDMPDMFLEFRLWNQGRVNIDTLSNKLKSAVRQATWDIFTEYFLLTKGLCEPFERTDDFRIAPVRISDMDIDLSKDIEFTCLLENNKSRIRPRVTSDDGRKLDALLLPRKKILRVIPPNARTTRSITFDDFEKDKEMNGKLQQNQNQKSLFKLDSYESGTEGILCENYAKFLPEWLEFGALLSVPSVRKHRIDLNTCHLPPVIIREVMNLVQDSPKAFRAVPTNALKSSSEEVFVSFMVPYYIQRCIIISRNLEHWKATTVSTGSDHVPDILNRQSLKHIQKFTPVLQSNAFIPRQKVLWILIESDSIVMYAYNWTKDSVEKLITNCTNLGLWLTVRSNYLNSVIAQKLGLFHNQPMTRKPFVSSNNPYASFIGNLDYMSEFPKDINRRSTLAPGPSILSAVETFRDAFHHSKYFSSDPVVVFTVEMREIRVIEKKLRDEMKKLHLLYQSRTSSTTVPNIQLLLQHSRIVHFCHTPLLFLPRWRLKSAATRDHSLFPTIMASGSERTQVDEKEAWHTDLCYSFFTDYRSFLQTLGFMPLQIDCQNRKPGLWTKDSSSYNSVFYIQKTILGGILLFTMEFVEPFFTTKLYAIECSRLQVINSQASINRFTLGFLDECDKIKISMHLHSFTYDYHLRTVYNYIVGNEGSRLVGKYNVNHFLKEFMKYYTKAPNFARNLVHADTMTIRNLLVEGKQLFEYLLSNTNQYNFKVLEMETLNGDPEYVLVQTSTTSQVFYKDAQDFQHADDFNVTLVVYYLCSPYNPTENILHLKYYLILTSKNEIYPKADVEGKIGKFRTVSSIRYYGNADKSPNDLSDRGETSTSDDQSTSESCESRYTQPVHKKDGIYNVEISQERVNYLGYYSSHEELMQQLILDKAKVTVEHIKDMVAKGMVDCRTHLLWNQLTASHDALSYEEFLELKDLSHMEHLCDVHPNLGFLTNQPLIWYQGLAKLLIVKYSEQYRIFNSTDGNIQHYVILHPRYFGAFMMLSMDMQTLRGDLYAVYRETHLGNDFDLCLAFRKELLDGFVNCICFYLWSGMI